MNRQENGALDEEFQNITKFYKMPQVTQKEHKANTNANAVYRLVEFQVRINQQKLIIARVPET